MKKGSFKKNRSLSLYYFSLTEEKIISVRTYFWPAEKFVKFAELALEENWSYSLPRIVMTEKYII